MRIVLASVALAAGLVSVAEAQEQPTAPAAATPAAAAPTAPAATPTAPPAAPTAAAPAAVAPAAPAAAPMAPAAAPAAPAAAPADPAAAPAAAAPVAEAPPTLPTTGDAATLISVMDKVCVPLVRGGSLDALAKAQGMKKKSRDGSWSMPIGAEKQYTVTIFALGSNPSTCRGELDYAIGGTDAIVKGLVVYAFLHQPELILQANYVQTGADGIKRVQRSWEHLEPASISAINFTTLSKPDDTPTAKNYQVAEFYYQERKLP